MLKGPGRPNCEILVVQMYEKGKQNGLVSSSPTENSFKNEVDDDSFVDDFHVGIGLVDGAEHDDKGQKCHVAGSV